LNYFNEHGINILAATDDDVYLWLEHLKEEKSPSTVQMYLVAVRLFFAFLHKQKIIADNPCEGMKAGVKIERDKHARDYLSVNRAQELIAAMPAETEMQLRNRAIVALMITSGLRCCEVQKALYGDFRTAGDSEVLFVQGKGHTGKDDYVKVAPVVGKMIREYLKVRFNGGEPKNKDYLFVSTSRNHAKLDKDDELSTQAIRAIAKAAFKAIGFNDSRHTAHALRHTAATLMLRSGEDLNNVKQVLRHSNIQTTMIYAHALEREKNNAELAVSNLIFGETK
jgi:integrase/recombinase XerC